MRYGSPTKVPQPPPCDRCGAPYATHGGPDGNLCGGCHAITPYGQQLAAEQLRGTLSDALDD